MAIIRPKKHNKSQKIPGGKTKKPTHKNAQIVIIISFFLLVIFHSFPLHFPHHTHSPLRQTTSRTRAAFHHLYANTPPEHRRTPRETDSNIPSKILPLAQQQNTHNIEHGAFFRVVVVVSSPFCFPR